MTAVVYSNLGGTYYRQGDFAKAEAMNKHALEIAKNVFGPEHRQVAIYLSNLAELYRTLGRYSQAEPILRKSILIAEKALGPKHIEVANKLNNLGMVYLGMERYEAAESTLNRALKIKEFAQGSEHPNVEITLGNLGVLYQSQNRISDAEKTFVRALAISRKAFGSEHLRVARNLNNLSTVYKKLHRYSEAEALQNKSLQIAENLLGPEHPHVATALDNMSMLNRLLGRFEIAIAQAQRALAIRMKVFGNEHRLVSTSLNNLALIFQTEGRYSEAETAIKRAISIDEKLFGPIHPTLAVDLRNYSNLLREMNRHDAAEAAAARAKKIELASRSSQKILNHAENICVTELKNTRSYYSKPRPIDMKRFENDKIWPLISFGIVNPYGPTLFGFLLLDGIQVDGAQLVYFQLNPFSQSIIAVHEITPETKTHQLRDIVIGAIANFDLLGNAATPTLLVPSKYFSSEDASDVLCSVLSKTKKLPDSLRLLKEFPGDPWKRVSKEMRLAFKKVKQRRTGTDISTNEAEKASRAQISEYSEIIGGEAHRAKELEAFLYAWDGSINFQKEKGSSSISQKVLSTQRFTNLIARLLK